MAPNKSTTVPVAKKAEAPGLSEDRYGDRVSSALSTFEWQYGSDSAAMRLRYEFKCKELVDLMGRKEFQATGSPRSSST